MSDQPARLAFGKHSGFKTILACACLAFLMTPSNPSAATADMTVNDFRNAGWTVVGKIQFDEWHEGKAPYEKLRRCVYTAIYTLQKDGKTVKCTLARDVMYDTFEQSCGEAK